AHADCEGRGFALADRAAGGGRPDGAHQLPHSRHRLYARLQRLRLRPVREARTLSTALRGSGDLDLPAHYQSRLVAPFQIRPGRMGLALAHLLAAATDAARRIITGGGNAGSQPPGDRLRHGTEYRVARAFSVRAGGVGVAPADISPETAIAHSPLAGQ